MIRKRLRWADAIMLLLALVSSSVFAQEHLPGFDTYVDKAMKEWRVPGLSIAIVKDDDVIHARGYGVKEFGNEDPVDERTLYAIGSTSKAFTATALGILRDEGKLDWNDRVQKHLPNFELFDPYVTREMTVRDLLCHRIGLSRGDSLWYGTEHSRHEILHRVRFLKPQWSVRSKFGYQNIMYLAAGETIPAITGTSWDDFVKQRLFLPLGMKTSNTSVRDLHGNVATPHSRIDGNVTPIEWRNIDNIGPAGSINSCVIEMSNWIRMQLGTGVFEGTRVVSEEVILETRLPQMIGRPGDFRPSANFLTYGLGWFLHDHHGLKVAEHGGAIDGMRAAVVLIPEKQVGAVVLSNLDRSNFGHALAYRALDAVLGLPSRDWSAEFLETVTKNEDDAEKQSKEREALRTADKPPSLPLERYVGTYRSIYLGDAGVRLVDGELHFRYGNAVVGELSHRHHNTWKLNCDQRWVGDRDLTFSLDRVGEVGMVEVDGMDTFIRLKTEPTEAPTSP